MSVFTSPPAAPAWDDFHFHSSKFWLPQTSPADDFLSLTLSTVICCKACKKNLKRRAGSEDISWALAEEERLKRAEHPCSVQAAKGSGSPEHQQHMKRLQRSNQSTHVLSWSVPDGQTVCYFPLWKGGKKISPQSSASRQPIKRLLLSHRKQVMLQTHSSAHICGLQQTSGPARGRELLLHPFFTNPSITTKSLTAPLTVSEFPELWLYLTKSWVSQQILFSYD